MHRPAARPAGRVLHRQGGHAARWRALLVAPRAGPAVGQLPREGLRLAGHPGHAGRRAREHVRSEPGLQHALGRARAGLPLAAVHDPAHLRRARAAARLAARGLRRPRRPFGHARSARWSCPSSSRRSWPARSSPSRCRSATTSPSASSGGSTQMIGSVVYAQLLRPTCPSRPPSPRCPIVDHDRLPARRPGGPAPSRTSDAPSPPPARWILRLATVAVLAVPVPAAGRRRDPVVQHVEVPGLAARRLHAAVVGRGGRTTPAPRDALLDQPEGGDRRRPLLALVLGTLTSFAVQRYRFFGREARQLPRRAAHRAARHRHRHRAELGLPPGRASSSGCSR